MIKSDMYDCSTVCVISIHGAIELHVSWYFGLWRRTILPWNMSNGQLRLLMTTEEACGILKRTTFCRRHFKCISRMKVFVSSFKFPWCFLGSPPEKPPEMLGCFGNCTVHKSKSRNTSNNICNSCRWDLIPGMCSFFVKKSHIINSGLTILFLNSYGKFDEKNFSSMTAKDNQESIEYISLTDFDKA